VKKEDIFWVLHWLPPAC